MLDPSFSRILARQRVAELRRDARAAHPLEAEGASAPRRRLREAAAQVAARRPGRGGALRARPAGRP